MTSNVKEQIQSFIDDGIIRINDDGRAQVIESATERELIQQSSASKKKAESEIIPTNRRQTMIFPNNQGSSLQDRMEDQY